MRVSLTK